MFSINEFNESQRILFFYFFDPQVLPGARVREEKKRSFDYFRNQIKKVLLYFKNGNYLGNHFVFFLFLFFFAIFV